MSKEHAPTVKDALQKVHLLTKGVQDLHWLMKKHERGQVKEHPNIHEHLDTLECHLVSTRNQLRALMRSDAKANIDETIAQKLEEATTMICSRFSKEIFNAYERKTEEVAVNIDDGLIKVSGTITGGMLFMNILTDHIAARIAAIVSIALTIGELIAANQRDAHWKAICERRKQLEQLCTDPTKRDADMK